MLPRPGRAVCPIGQAVLQPCQVLPQDVAAGRISAEYVWAYPPGVPLLAPGEKITPEFLTAARNLQSAGTRLHHSRCAAPAQIAVLQP